MPELRRDPIIGRWVIIATERAKRPDQFAVGKEEEHLKEGEKCPFCEGNESMTPPEIYALRKPGTQPNKPGWEVRVVPNKFPVLGVEGELDRRGRGMYDLINARGAHEVVIETPLHIKEHQIPEGHICKILNVIIGRMQDLERDSRIRYVLAFKNYGKVAGGSHIVHSRSQLMGTPVTPKRVKEELVGARRYFEYKERCVYCDMIRQECDSAKRVIAQVGDFIAINPFASRFPFETWLLPIRHACDFHRTRSEDVTNLARLMWQGFARMTKALGDFPYNLIIHTAPFRNYRKKGYWDTIQEDYHWHIEMMPMLTRVAGFEWGSGFYINPMPPEDACKFLKEIQVP
jgi:UDPglucose--hexose-1-phosphate uridylyltransferase